MRLENKVAIVTGGAKGLGGAMAQLALQRSAPFSAGEESELVVVV